MALNDVLSATKGMAWGGDDFGEAKQSLNQKEALTAQMIGIISARLNALQVMANNRKLGLECDMRVHSTYCSKLVPGLQDPYESRLNSGIGKARAGAASTNASTQAMMERLFGPDDKSRSRTQALTLKKKKNELHKGEHRRNLRTQMEKQLQASIEGHVTRSVESFTYSDRSGEGDRGGGGGIHVNTRLLLLYTFERMHISHGRKAFKRFLLSELSAALFEDIFWLTFCHFFQQQSTELQHALVDTISGRYIKVLASLPTNLDFIFRIFPYALGGGACWAFHYVFPGSRHLYSPDFKNEVYLFVCQLLLGLKLSPTSVQTMRRELFPDEILDEAIGKGKLGSSKPSTAPETSDIALLPPLSGSASASSLPLVLALDDSGSRRQLQKSASEALYIGRQTLTDNTIEKILEDHGDRSVEPRDSEFMMHRVPLRRHQPRTLFNAAQLSPLMKDYFKSSTKSIKKPYFLLRTAPSAECRVGGEDTYEKHYHRKAHPSFAVEAHKQQEKCQKELQKLQRETRRELDALNERRELVLGSGKVGVRAYCSALLSTKSPAEAGNSPNASNPPSPGHGLDTSTTRQ